MCSSDLAIAEAKETGAPVPLRPMNPFERKVVHDEVLAAGLKSDSSGTEPRRFVVVHPAQVAPADGESAEPADGESGADTAGEAVPDASEV